MKLLDLTLGSPAGNLACDEALLNWSEDGDNEEILRFWEPREYFVVVGYANRVETEVDVAACEVKQVPIFRRCSGGGTVLQGPGCLNYALILQIAKHPSLASISRANKFIMERNGEAVQSALGDRHSPISVCGHTDLALGGRKFSGNSQRRHKCSLLFHGTFLLKLDLPLIPKVLRRPSQQPDYRMDRSHIEFLTNLNVPAARLKSELGKIWNATGESHDYPEQATQKLTAEKYSAWKWNFKL